MKTKQSLGLIMLAAMLLAFAPLARAVQVQWDYSATDQSSPTPITVSALLTTSDSPISVGLLNGYLITGIAGTRTDVSGSVAITDLFTNTALWTIDNNLITAPVYGFDNAGIGFLAGGQYNVYSVGTIQDGSATYYESFGSGGPHYNPGYTITSQTFSQVPDTASTLALFGLGLVGLAGARKFMGRQELTLPTPI